MKNLTEKKKLGLYVSGTLILVSAIIVVSSLGVINEAGGCGGGIQEGAEKGDSENDMDNTQESTKGLNIVARETIGGDIINQPDEFCKNVINYEDVVNYNDLNLAISKNYSINKKETIYSKIRKVATAPNSENSHPLPLLSSWNTSTFWNYDLDTAGFSPDFQMDLIDGKIDDKNHYILPFFAIPTPNQYADTGYAEPIQQKKYFDYTGNNSKSAIKRAAQNKLPLIFIGTQWEQQLSFDPYYQNLREEDNPIAISLDGELMTFTTPWGERNILSPFGSARQANLWHEVGYNWGSGEVMKYLQELYPDPPLVIFISNNEQPKLRWVDVENEKRYVAKYGTEMDDNFKRMVVAKGWNVRYCNLLKGFRDGLASQRWKKNARFIAYGANESGAGGRYDEWKEWSLYVDDFYEPSQNNYKYSQNGSIIDPHPLYWQGTSASLYMGRPGRLYSFSTMDNVLAGPLFWAFNWHFMKEEALRLNRNFWWELSTWDDDAIKDNVISSARYGGFVQFAMWLVRPRNVNEFRVSNEPRTRVFAYFEPLMNNVDRVHNNETLKKFWQNSKIVLNPDFTHPYTHDWPEEYKGINRDFLLATNIDPQDQNPSQPGVQWTDIATTFNVMCLARTRERSPKREWLVYCYAPGGYLTSIEVTIPQYKKVILKGITEGGTFYLVKERNKSISLVERIENKK